MGKRMSGFTVCVVLLLIGCTDENASVSIIGDPDFRLATDETYWFRRADPGIAISSDGDGIMTITGDASQKTIYSKIGGGLEPHPAILGQRFNAIVRWRRTTEVTANFGVQPTMRLLVYSTDGSYPPKHEGGTGQVVDIAVSTVPINEWQTTRASFEEVSGDPRVPFVIMRIDFPVNFLASGTIEIDEANAIPVN